MSFGNFGEPGYGITRTFSDLSVEDAVTRVTEKLAAEGFGVLSTIDVSKTLDSKIGAKVRPYIILGACSPQLALEAITEEPGIGLVMPCNVVVSLTDEDDVSVSVIDPVALFKAVDRPDMAPFAQAVREQLERVMMSM